MDDEHIKQILQDLRKQLKALLAVGFFIFVLLSVIVTILSDEIGLWIMIPTILFAGWAIERPFHKD